jgi:murein L,D-transpeptidase YcbB/YkuD
MAAAARETLDRAPEQGLRAQDYYVPAPPPPGLTRGGDVLGYDVALTRAVLRYARDVRTGRVRPNDVYKDVGLPASTFSAAAYLQRALDTATPESFLEDLPPSHPEYWRLAAALARYNAIVDDGGWPAIPGRDEIRLERDDTRRAALIERLGFEDPELAADANPTAAEIREAVKRFQARHGLDGDGRAGPNTLTALNVPATERVAQIAANMERWRWLPQQFERRYVAVDVPNQSLTFIQDGRAVLNSRVIVGAKVSHTPILRTMAQAIVASPPWNVPGDIAARDFLPELRKDPNYLRKRNMVILDGPPGDPHGRTIDWRNVEPQEFYYHVRELPGPRAGLGELMFDMPNDFDVYLHDTPGKELFAERERTISNGCIRVQEIFQLASLAMTGDAEEGIANLRTVIRKRQTERLTLNAPLPVYLLYWTAVADPDGTVEFRADPYSRDAPLITQLSGRPPLEARVS